jgi:radical SAM protein with 4Fe4S-binding SPASM domain
MKDKINFKSAFALSPSTRILLKGDQAILLNLISSEWIRIPQKICSLIEDCTKNSPENEITKFSQMNNLPQINIKNLIEYLLSQNFIQQSAILNLNGIEIIYHTLTDPQELKIEEIIKIQKVTLRITKDSEKNIYDILYKIKDLNINNIVLYISDIEYIKTINDIIEYSSSLFNSVGVILEMISPDQFSLIEGLPREKLRFFLNGDSFLERNLLNNDIKEYLINLNEGKFMSNYIYSITCSYNALNYNTFFDFITILSELKIPFSLNTCFPTLNKKYLINDTAHYTNLFIKTLNHSVEFKSLTSFDYRYYRLTKLSCGAGKLSVYISEKGNVYPCAELLNNHFILGNILDDKFSKIEQRASELLKKSNVENYKKCRNCNISYFCGGGCLSRHLNMKNIDTKVQDPMCDFIYQTIGQDAWAFNENQDHFEYLNNLIESILVNNETSRKNA